MKALGVLAVLAMTPVAFAQTSSKKPAPTSMAPSASASAAPVFKGPAIVRLATDIAAGIATFPPGTLIAVSPLVSDIPAPKGEDLARLIGAQLGGRLNAKVHPQPVALSVARAASGRAGSLVYVQLEIAKGVLHATADLYPAIPNGWERLRNPVPGPQAHAFAEVSIDAEVRTFLQPIVLEQAKVSRAKHEEGDVIAVGCGDLDADGGLELVLASKQRIAVREDSRRQVRRHRLGALEGYRLRGAGSAARAARHDDGFEQRDPRRHDGPLRDRARCHADAAPDADRPADPRRRCVRAREPRGGRVRGQRRCLSAAGKGFETGGGAVTADHEVRRRRRARARQRPGARRARAGRQAEAPSCRGRREAARDLDRADRRPDGARRSRPRWRAGDRLQRRFRGRRRAHDLELAPTLADRRRPRGSACASRRRSRSARSRPARRKKKACPPSLPSSAPRSGLSVSRRAFVAGSLLAPFTAMPTIASARGRTPQGGKSLAARAVADRRARSAPARRRGRRHLRRGRSGTRSTSATASRGSRTATPTRRARSSA